MVFENELIHGRLIRRYKRFLADVLLDDGREVTAHCTNSGSMKSCVREGAEVFLSPAADPARKTAYTWEMIRMDAGWVGVNTARPNALVHEWLSKGILPSLEGLTGLRREVTWGDSRFDLYGEDPRPCYIEVKNVTMKDGPMALFPDARTERGRKHLNTLMRIREEGMRAVMVYVVQRTDVERFAPARDIDPAYADTLARAVERGVEALAARARVDPSGIVFDRLLPMDLTA
ncbi:MAG: DNA/RNA nuclease SfsA [Bacteroidales bacterium]